MGVFRYCQEHGVFDVDEYLAGARAPCEHCDQKIAGRRRVAVVSSTPTHEFEFTKKGALPRMPGLNGDKRTSKQLNADIDKWQGERRREIQQNHDDRRLSKRKPSLKPVGSVDIYEYIALKRQTGDPHIWRNPKDALKRLGKWQGD